MRHRLLFLLPTLVMALPARADETPVSTTDPKRVEQLVSELGSDVFLRRELASKELETLGTGIIEALRSAARSPDLEVSRRAAELVRKAEDKINTAAFLKPKMVRLDLKDVSVLEALRQLSIGSGYSLQFVGDVTAVQQRSVSFSTGEVSFWEAFDRLCREGGLVEGNGTVIPSAAAASRVIKLPAQFLPAPPAKKNNVAAGGPGGVAAPAAPWPPVLGRTGSGIVVRDGRPAQYPTSYQGSLRIRVLPPSIVVGRILDNQTQPLVVLEVTPEPRFTAFKLDNRVRIEKAINNLTQVLQPVETTSQQDAFLFARKNPSHPSMAMVRLRGGDRPAQSLAELVGRIDVESLMPTEPVLTLEKPMDAIGRGEFAKDGRMVTVLMLKELANGHYGLRIRVDGSLDQAAPAKVPAAALQVFAKAQVAPLGGRVSFSTAGTVSAASLPLLLDADGVPLRLAGVGTARTTFDGVKASQDVTATYVSDNGRQPMRMVLNGQRKHMVQVPFAFRDVPLQ